MTLNNTTLQNITHTGCPPYFEYRTSIFLFILSVSSVLSFVGNLVVILIVYKNKQLRTPTYYCIVNMSVSDIVFPLFWLLLYNLLSNRLGHVSQFAGNLLCKFLPFISHVSYGVSMLSLAVITVYRFSAVMFPMRARVQNKTKRILALLLTWAIPIAVLSPRWVYGDFNEEHQYCHVTLLTFSQRRIWWTVTSSLFFFLPLLIMLILYPVVLVKLGQRKVPGNTNRPQAAIRRRKQNFRLTMMFVIMSTAFVLTWGLNIINLMMVYYFPTFLFKITEQPCVFLYYFREAGFAIPAVFHAINPMIYFVFCSSFRKGLKQIFSCCYRAAGNLQLPAANNMQLHVITQECQYS